MFSDEFKIIKGRMMLAAKTAFQRVVVLPIPELATNSLVALGTSYANEFSAFLAPRHAVEVPGFSADAADKPPVQVASRVIGVDIFCRFTHRLTAVSGMYRPAIFAYHLICHLLSLTVALAFRINPIACPCRASWSGAESYPKPEPDNKQGCDGE